jgi:hypothetical protein
VHAHRALVHAHAPERQRALGLAEDQRPFDDEAPDRADFFGDSANSS